MRVPAVSMECIQKGESDAHDEEEGDDGPELEVLAGVEVAAVDFAGRRPRLP